MVLETIIPTDPVKRLGFVLDLAWEVFFSRVVSGKVNVNKEASMQLHLAAIILSLGETMCVLPNEQFQIELETKVHKQNVDITCMLGDAKAALELKCFRKASNRAVDTDMYDVLKDISRLVSYEDFQVRRFFCLTDYSYYASSAHTGHAASVTIKDGTKYDAGTVIRPTWIGQWKNKNRDETIKINTELIIRWEKSDKWYAMRADL